MVSAAVGVVLGRAYSHGRNPGLKSLMDLYNYGKLINHYLPKHCTLKWIFLKISHKIEISGNSIVIKQKEKTQHPSCFLKLG